MNLIELDNFPVQYKDILVFPEYFISYEDKASFYAELSYQRREDVGYYVVGVGQTEKRNFTSVLLLNKSLTTIGVRRKISMFWEESGSPATRLEAFEISNQRRLGIVVCKEVLHTAIAEVYRMMKVNIVAVTIGGGDFWDLQRHSWIDQMILFSDICDAPLICACGATKQEGGINIIIER